jgi:hypothetical protein
MVRNHFFCDACPNEWADVMPAVGTGFCPCCDAEAEPYHSEPIKEMAE